MTLGEKLRQARKEAGLSQRQLAGDEMTRNMLSQVENDLARPSLGSLQYLAQRLGKSVGYFLEGEQEPEAPALRSAREHYLQGQHRQALEQLVAQKARDGSLNDEMALLENLCRLELARKARLQGREKYARELLSSRSETVYWYRSLRLQWDLECWYCGLNPQLPGPEDQWVEAQALACLPEDPARAGAILDGFPRQDSRWYILRGRVCQAQEQWQQAIDCYLRAEKDQPGEVLPRLEKCYEALEDFKSAYSCAKKLRQLE